MKLKTKIFYLTDETGEEIDVDYINVAIALNGKITDKFLRQFFSYAEYDEGEIYGNSLFSYYAPQEDGTIAVPGSIIGFFNSETQEQIKVTRIVRPTVNDDEHISFDLVKEFAHIFQIAKPEEVFDNLNDEEKQYFIDERSKTTTSQQQQEEATKAEEESKRIIAEAKRKADEKKIRESINPDSIQEKRDYKITQSFYENNECKEYIAHPYHLFYGKGKPAEPAILIKRGDAWWQECSDGVCTDENDKTVTFEFNDLDKPKQLTLNIASGEINVVDAEG